MTLVFELASARVPVSLADVRAESAAPDDGAICYRISGPCGGALGSFTSQYDEPESFWREPIVFTCADCGRSATIFDSRKHGYDFEDEEIEQWWNEEDRARMPDLFSSVAFRLTCGGCGEEQWLGGFECA